MTYQKLLLVMTVLFSQIAFAKEIIITQKDKEFRDTNGKLVKNIDVQLTDVLKFKNDDAITHNIYSISPKNQFELKIQKPGETGEVILNSKKHRPGKMEVECAIHPKMKLIVNIQK